MKRDNTLAKRIATLSPEKRALLEARLKKNNSAKIQLTIPVRQNHAPAPLSFAQQRLWFLDQLEPESSAYNIPAALRLSGHLDISALEQSFNEIIRRHEALRTSFALHEDQAMQIIATPAPLDLPLVDLSHLPLCEAEAEAQRHATEEAQRPFDLARGPLL